MVSYINKHVFLHNNKEYLWMAVFFEGEDTFQFIQFLAYKRLVTGPLNGMDEGLTPYLLQKPPLRQVLSPLKTPQFFLKD